MPNYSFLKISKLLLAVLVALFLTSLCGAAEVKKSTTNFNSGKTDKQALSVLREEARRYRQEGYDLQRVGDLDSALTFYQKAIELDKDYAVPYNDLGVISEAKGNDVAAEECYLQAIKIDPEFLSAYTNLALFYENKGDKDKAYTYWKKRAEKGAPEDLWTQKAKQRVGDTDIVNSKDPVGQAREQEILSITSEVKKDKTAIKGNNKTLTQDYFQKAKDAEQKGDDLTALTMAVNASQFDSSNTEIADFIDKIQARLLSK